MAEKKKKILKTKDEPIERISLVESIKREKEANTKGGRGIKREICQSAFRLWLSIPDTFRGMPDVVIDKMGIGDPDILELLDIKSQSEFGRKFDVKYEILSLWKSQMKEGESFDDVKAFFKKLTKNVLGSLYREMQKQGDAPRAKLFMQIVEDWNEQMGIKHSGAVVYELDEKEKMELDKLLGKNTK